jgi:hypothetical protein
MVILRTTLEYGPQSMELRVETDLTFGENKNLHGFNDDGKALISGTLEEYSKPYFYVT